MNLRTDLVAENNEFTADKEIVTSSFGECDVYELNIKDDKTAKLFNKPKGKYFTIKFKSFLSLKNTCDLENALFYTLNNLIPEHLREEILIVGLGNSDITPDALGPLTADKIFATRHIGKELRERLNLEGLKSVCALVPGVIGKTGIEAAETVLAAARSINPTAIIVIDALAACNAQNLCCTIQLSDSGINPGSGVNNSRKELSYNTLGVPVIAIGIPTVTDSASIIKEGEKDIQMMVTPKEIDMLIEKASQFLSDTLNTFLQPDIEPEIIKAIT